MSPAAKEFHLDTRGSLCPQPIIDLAREIKRIPAGSTLVIRSDDAAFPLDLRAWCAGNRHEFLGLQTSGRIHVGRVRKTHD